MTNIWDVFQFINFVTNHFRNGFNSITEVTSALTAGQQALQKEYYGDGKELNQVSTDALLPFSKSIPLTSNSTGLITPPADYAHIRRLTNNSGTLTYVPSYHSELNEALKSQLYPIAEYPVYVADAGGFQLYPSKPTTCKLHYYGRPADPVIGYTTPGEDPVYNPATSVQLEFYPQYWIEVVLKSLPYVAVNLSDTEVFALSSQFQPKAPQ